MVRLPIVLPIIVVGFWLTDAKLELGLAKLLTFTLAVALAWSIRFYRQYSFGLLTFWTDQSTAIENLWLTLYMVLGGALAPLSLFPEPLQAVLRFTPFPYTIDFPVRVLLGTVQGSELWRGLLGQVLWVLLFVLLRLVMWRQGLRLYGAVGA